MKLNNQKFSLGPLQEAPIFLSGILSAALPLLGTFFPLLFPLSFWTSAPLLYIGFSRGLKACAISSTLSLILTFLLTFKENALLFFIFHILPSLAITAFVLSNRTQTRTTHLILGLTTYSALIGLGLSFLLIQTIDHLVPIVESFANQNGLDSKSLTSWISWAPGFVCLGSAGVTLVNSIFAQRLALHRWHLKKVLFDLNALTLNDTLLVGLALSGLGVFFLEGFLEICCQTFVLVLCFPYLTFSFTTLHLAAEQTGPKKPFILFAVYALLFLLVWPLLIMVGLSIFEPWLRLRARLIEKS